MNKHLFLCLLLVFTVLTTSLPTPGEIFTESGLVDIPTGAVLAHGVFGVGTFAAFQQNAPASGLQTAPPALSDAIAIRLNFGLLDRLEIGLRHTWYDHGYELSTEGAADLKVQLLQEQEAGVLPSIAVGIEHLGNRVLTSGSVENGIQPSAFLSVSKTFNLPRIHQFSGHIGIGTERFAFEEGSVGLFAGVSREFQPAFARGDITASLEFDGSGVNAGVRYITYSGLQVAFGAETLNDPDAFRYLAAVSWTNAHLLEQIDETRRLIQRATELAVAAKRAAAAKKADQ